MGFTSEFILYWLAKRLYRSELAHTKAMKQALSGPDQLSSFRRDEVTKIGQAAKQFDIEIAEKITLDLGCSDGSISAGIKEQLHARQVVGVDIDAKAIERARSLYGREGIEFVATAVDSITLPDNHVDVIVCYDVLEHVAQPAAILTECRRVLRPGGKILIGTWGWYHPYAPHLWATMPVPWAHVFFSEKTMLHVCRRVYESEWYVPNMYDLDENGVKKEDRYRNETISTNYLNKHLIRDFERIFREGGWIARLHPRPFGSRWARWTKAFLQFPWIREFVTGYLWVVLEKPTGECASSIPS